MDYSIALLVAGAFFMENLDGTVIATALPALAASFGVNAVSLHIGMTAYMLTLGVLIPISGWLADRVGARTVFTVAILVFTGASILCGLADSLGAFTAARVLQGVGGAMMVPVGRLVVLRVTAKQDLITAIAYLTWPALMAPIIGPPLGGLITEHASWRWIFFLNVPLGLIGAVAALRLIPNDRPAGRPPLDLTGFVLSGLACAGFMYALDLMGQPDASWTRAGLIVLAALLVGVVAVRHFQRTAHPLIDLQALSIPTFAVTIWGGSLFRMAINAAPFLLPLMFQLAFGMDAFSAGLLVLAVFAGNMLMKFVTTPILRRFGFKRVLVVNGVLTALSLAACALLTPGTPVIVILAVLFFSGLGRSMQFTALNTLGFADVPTAQISAANTFSSMVFQLNAGLGVAIGAIVLKISTALRGVEHAGTIDFQVAFGVIGVMALLAVVDCLGLRADAGRELSGRTVARRG